MRWVAYDTDPGAKPYERRLRRRWLWARLRFAMVEEVYAWHSSYDEPYWAWRKVDSSDD